jgi:hypothetical protein
MDTGDDVVPDVVLHREWLRSRRDAAHHTLVSAIARDDTIV